MTPRTLRIAALALGIVAMILTGFLFRRAPSPPATVREAFAKQITWRNDRMHFADEPEPFTGHLVEQYPGGQPKARSVVERGLLNGVSEGWYTNGVLQVREYFRQGVSHGLRTKWFPDGRKLSEAPVVDGHLTGFFRRWHENGQLAEEVEMTNDLPHGVTRIFYPNGTLKAEARLQLGRVLEQQVHQSQGNPALTATPTRP